MKYTPPIGATDPNAPYVDANPAAGIQGSPVPAAAIEPSMREIINVITDAGLTPSSENLSQLKQAINALIAAQGIANKANILLDNLSEEGLDLVAPAGQVVYTMHTNFTNAEIVRARLIYAGGAEVSRTVYARLFAKIGTTFGTGNGSTTFNLPDLRGDFLRGLGGHAPETFARQSSMAPNISGTFGNIIGQTASGAFFVAASGLTINAGASYAGNHIGFAANRVSSVYSEGAVEIRPQSRSAGAFIRY